MSSAFGRRLLGSLLIAPAGVLLATASVSAGSGSPHFIAHDTSGTLSGSSLVVSFKEAGLPSGASEIIVTRATATTTYECVNGGGKNPSASNKTTTQSPVSTSGTFTADRNGNVIGSEALTPPTAASLGFGCPPGQTVTFVSVTYSGVTITDTTSGASTSLSGSFTDVNPSAP